MSSLTFKALIDGVHFDPKKGAVKIQLIAASHVSMDKLISLGPADESVKITLESAQTKITGVGVSIALSPEAIAAPEEDNHRFVSPEFPTREGKEEKDKDQIATEFPLSEAEGDKDEVEEGREI